ncbi:hypothetical protein B296_00005246 [Ensete ventricosum]|uniref:Uncharacterized protein n=1 Tax=Ensete ventricosum TaxID=4639 RepID=A0A427ART0_ENSVE|nr:hypothetical protein B296_00005246 [Ensete ventricosum]
MLGLERLSTGQEDAKRHDQSDWRVGLLQCLSLLKGARQVRGQDRLSIPCSLGGGALVIKGGEEMKNVEANSKYQDKMEGQRPRNFIRLVSMDFSSR